MDYQRIYTQFIDDRKGREPALLASGKYKEVHHILPRSLGGTDEPENLVALTAEDHLRAHLLIAKIHGGRMWVPILRMQSFKSMPKSRRRRIPTKTARKAFAIARIAFGKYSSEMQQGVERPELEKEGNPLFNPTVYHWVNADTGAEEHLTIYDMHAKYGGSRPSYTQVISGGKPSVSGWHLKERPLARRNGKGKTFVFVNRDGRRFEGTQGQFAKYANASIATASRVTRHGDVTTSGWRLEGTPDRWCNAPKNGERPGKKASVITMVKAGQVLSGDRNFWAKTLGKTVSNVSASVYCLKKNKMKTFAGWALVDA